MNNQEGGKPQLTLVGEQAQPEAQPLPATPAGNLMDIEFARYADKVAWLINNATNSKLSGVGIDNRATLEMLDPEQDNSAIRDWMANNEVLTKSGFDKLMARIGRERIVDEALGFVPNSATDFIDQFTERNGVSLTPRGTLNRSRPFKVGGELMDETNAQKSRTTQMVFEVANAEGDNLDSLARELRLLSDKLRLGYRDSVIGDALASWQEKVTRQAKVDAMMAVEFERGHATGPKGQEMWQAMETACFDISETAPGFAIAVVKKFMWQVKRKSRGMVVTNHLMPVLTGAQGKGKTQFVKAMTAPLRDLMREVDFQMLTDSKTTDIWSALILFIDEMGFFKKADVDKVKNVITTTELSIRSMRQNHSAVIKNAATLIGCSNVSLGQLIRDETGGRRFAELVWRNDPDWEASNAVDWELLWKSVDEEDADPMLAGDFMDKLREQQEANRNQSPVEIWARESGATETLWRKASDMHQAFREWEREAFPRAETNQTMFGRTMTNLIASMPDFPMEKKADRSGVSYRGTAR